MYRNIGLFLSFFSLGFAFIKLHTDIVILQCIFGTITGVFAWILLRGLLPVSLLDTLHDKTVLITGCDTGFGNKLAKRLDELGVTVYAGCLAATEAVDLKQTCSTKLHIVQLDVTKDDEVKEAVKYVKNTLGNKNLASQKGEEQEDIIVQMAENNNHDGKKEETDSRKILHTYPLVRRETGFMNTMNTGENQVLHLCSKGSFKASAEIKGIIVTLPYNITFSTRKLTENHSDMPDEIKTEAIELVTTACEKYSANNEMAARMIKETMDRKFGPSWHVVVGEGFGFEITYECRTIMYMYFGGNLAACIWKCS